jgi:LacI family transcriptional regulator
MIMTAKPAKMRRTGTGSPTLTDVARLCGFSPMTVSRVINGDVKVRESTQNAVRAAIAQLHYSPNMAARSLAAASSVRIGLLYNNPSAAYLSRFLLGSLEQAGIENAELVIKDCMAEHQAPDMVHQLIAARMDGIILSPPLCDSSLIRGLVEQSGIAAVAVSNWQVPGAISSIWLDDFGAAQAMTDHIIGLGHIRIGFIKGSPAQQASVQRLGGFTAAMARAGLNVEAELIVDGQFTYRSGIAATEALLNLAHPPTAIFACNDDMAAAAITVAHRRGLDVPGQISICGFDDTDFAESIWPELTTIHQPVADMARRAITVLVENVRAVRAGIEPVATSQLVPYRLISRESSGPVPRQSLKD